MRRRWPIRQTDRQPRPMRPRWVPHLQANQRGRQAELQTGTEHAGTTRGMPRSPDQAASHWVGVGVGCSFRLPSGHTTPCPSCNVADRSSEQALPGLVVVVVVLLLLLLHNTRIDSDRQKLTDPQPPPHQGIEPRVFAGSFGIPTLSNH